MYHAHNVYIYMYIHTVDVTKYIYIYAYMYSNKYTIHMSLCVFIWHEHISLVGKFLSCM